MLNRKNITKVNDEIYPLPGSHTENIKNMEPGFYTVELQHEFFEELNRNSVLDRFIAQFREEAKREWRKEFIAKTSKVLERLHPTLRIPNTEVFPEDWESFEYKYIKVKDKGEILSNVFYSNPETLTEEYLFTYSRELRFSKKGM